MPQVTIQTHADELLPTDISTANLPSDSRGRTVAEG